MKQSINVVGIPRGTLELASSRLRFYKIFKNLNNSVFHSKIFNQKKRGIGIHSKKILFLFKNLLWADIIYIQKMIHWSLVPILFLANVLGKKLILDIDDAVYLHHNDNLILKLVSSIIVSVPLIKKDIKKITRNKIYVIPTGIEIEKYSAKKKDNNKICIGWIGSPNTEKNLLLLKEQFKYLSKKYINIYFKIVGARKMRGLLSGNVIFKKWRLENFYKEISDFDIGIAPLEDTPFNRRKAGYKLLQYLALGIPSIASPLGFNKVLIMESKAILSATNWKTWVKNLRLLIENKKLREKYSKNAKNYITKYDFYKIVKKYEEIFIKEGK